MNREYARKQRFVTVDINALNVEQLEQLRDMLKYIDRAECEAVNEMISWEYGWMTPEHSAEFFKKYVSAENR